MTKFVIAAQICQIGIDSISCEALVSYYIVKNVTTQFLKLSVYNISRIIKPLSLNFRVINPFFLYTLAFIKPLRDYEKLRLGHGFIILPLFFTVQNQNLHTHQKLLFMFHIQFILQRMKKNMHSCRYMLMTCDLFLSNNLFLLIDITRKFYYLFNNSYVSLFFSLPSSFVISYLYQKQLTHNTYNSRIFQFSFSFFFSFQLFSRFSVNHIQRQILSFTRHYHMPISLSTNMILPSTSTSFVTDHHYPSRQLSTARIRYCNLRILRSKAFAQRIREIVT